MSPRRISFTETVKGRFSKNYLLKLKFDFNSHTILSVTEFKVFANRTMNLSNMPIGESAKVIAVNGNNQITRRLMEMGVVPGASVRMIKSAPFGDPLEVRVRGYHLAMRKSEADQIEVSGPESEVLEFKP
jgi:ferrous iron transport protein A